MSFEKHIVQGHDFLEGAVGRDLLGRYAKTTKVQEGLTKRTAAEVRTDW